MCENTQCICMFSSITEVISSVVSLLFVCTPHAELSQQNWGTLMKRLWWYKFGREEFVDLFNFTHSFKVTAVWGGQVHSAALFHPMLQGVPDSLFCVRQSPFKWRLRDAARMEVCRYPSGPKKPRVVTIISYNVRTFKPWPVSYRYSTTARTTDTPQVSLVVHTVRSIIIWTMAQFCLYALQLIRYETIKMWLRCKLPALPFQNYSHFILCTSTFIFRGSKVFGQTNRIINTVKP